MVFDERSSAIARSRALVLSVVLLACAVAAQAASAAGIPFQRGDVFVAGNRGVQEYSPSGQLRQTISGTAGASAMCFNPSGSRLVLPGIGLFDRSGNPLPSSWASITGAYGCVADGSGDVYVSSSPLGNASFTVTKYSIAGASIRTFQLERSEALPEFAIDLAPDQCTIYYGDYGMDSGLFNVCTNTQISFNLSLAEIDELRVLPNWQVLAVDDYTAVLSDGLLTPALRIYDPPPSDAPIGSLQTIGLDPDGTSFWACCEPLVSAIPASVPTELMRFDIQSGALLTQWPVPSPGDIAVYGPPLLGDANLGRTVDSDAPGTAEAFAARAGYSGQVTSVHLWVDSSSAASQVIVGIYSEHHGDPGALLTQGTITSVRPGSWNYVEVPATPVTAGQRYWIAVLGPKGGSPVRFRDAASGGHSQTSAQRNLIALPANWSPGSDWPSSALSAWGGG